MSTRLDPRPLFNALTNGIRLRRNIGEEPEDRFTKLFLFGLPIGVFFASIVAGLKLPAADQVIAGAALFIGAMLAGFSQLAAWRERLTTRNLKIDGAKMRMLDEAIAHVLVSALAAAWLTGALVVAANSHYGWVNVLMSSIAASTMVYLGVSLLVVVNLLWDAYRGANPASPPMARPRDDGHRQAG